MKTIFKIAAWVAGIVAGTARSLMSSGAARLSRVAGAAVSAVRAVSAGSIILSVSVVCMLLFAATAAAQQSGDYILPVKIPVYLSGNVGELRGNHFHSGIDIKTQGVTGKPVYSIAAGYVSRVSVSPWGFGLALYIQHPNGTTSVYGHLDRFMPELAQYVRSQQNRRKSYSVELYPDKSLFPVEQGELVAYAGDTGSSGGPHLHFEIRDASQQPYNILAGGLMSLEDNIPPRVVTLYYISVDTVAGVPVHTTRHTVTIPTGSSKRYTVNGGAPIKVAPKGYFAAEVSERKNGTTNVFAIYSAGVRLDSEPVFGFAIDKVNFGNTRYSQALAQYPEAKGKRNGVYKLAVLPNNILPIYKNTKNRGIISLSDDAVHNVEVEVRDDSGNSTVLYFKIQRGLEAGAVSTDGTPALWDRPFTYSADGLDVAIPPRALYESVLFTAAVKPPSGGGYSPVYDVHNPDVPLQSNITVSIDAQSLPENLKDKALVGRISGGRRSSAGGGWANGKVETRTNSFGSFYIAVDTIPPRITPSFKTDENFGNRNSISFVISDDFSGIDTYSATIDGEWALFEYTPSSSRITHYFDIPKQGTRHKIELTVTDGKGNKRIFNGSFIR